MKLIKVQVVVDLDLEIDNHIDPEWAARSCISWNKWAVDDVPGVKCTSAFSGVASFKVVKPQLPASSS